MFSQTIARIEVKGYILTDESDVEGITIFNSSSKIGTISNEKGEFSIAIALNDVVEISALQFEPVSIKITDEIIKLKILKVYLTEQLYKLEAIVISAGLSGNILLDIDHTEKRPTINLSYGDLRNYETHDRIARDEQVGNYELNKIINKGRLYNGIDFVQILNPVFKLLVKSKKKKDNSGETLRFQESTKLDDVYTHNFISKTFSIPLEKVSDFIRFIEEAGMDQDLLSKEKEVERLEFLFAKSALFMISRYAKD